MIEQALYQHLRGQDALLPFLARYGDFLAVFNQEAPADNDPNWEDGPQYGRIVFSVDLQGDPERIMGGMLAVDILCKEDEQYPEDIEPVVRALIHGYFFSSGTFTVSAQWKNSSYFTQPQDKVTGCTVSFDLLAFPVSTYAPDVIAQFNEWASTIPNLHVINHDPLPAEAWKPSNGQSAVYWRVAREAPSSWIRNSHSTLWMTATVRGYVFSETPAVAAAVSINLATQLYTVKRLKKDGQLLRAGYSPIMVNWRNTVDQAADPLRVGQLTVEAVYGINVRTETDTMIQHIYKEER